MAGFSFSDTSHQTVGDIASRALGGNITFGITGSQVQNTVVIVAGIAAAVVVLWLIAKKRKE